MAFHRGIWAASENFMLLRMWPVTDPTPGVRSMRTPVLAAPGPRGTWATSEP